ncbi:MAG: hypothetical protein LBS74_08160 [Oscillospiraceae bacterium]|jgi:hypothetical protein|nr:hypothetical protein [Oscillospiraceae bacterium]
MNKLLLKEATQEHVVYFYQPEGQGEPGEIFYDFKTQETTIREKASDDDTGYYARNAAHKIREYVKGALLPLHSIQAWY